MKTTLRIGSLALLTIGLCSGRAAADVAQYNPATGLTNVTHTRPTSGSLFESAVPSGTDARTPYKPSPSGGLAELVDPVLYSQPPEFLDGFGFFSDAVPGQFYDQKIADNFVTPSGPAWVLTGVRWWGASETFEFPDYTNILSFTVEVYADAGGVPGASLTGSLVYPTAATNPTVVGVGGFGQDVYVQEVAIPDTLVPASTAAWVSVSATIDDPFGDAFVWNFSVPADGVIAAELPVGAPYQTFAGFGEVSFEITGHAVPEPGSIALASIGAAALGFVALRRKR